MSSRTACSSQTAPASRCCRPSGRAGRRARRSSSSSFWAGRQAARARTRERAVGVPPGRTGRRPGPAAPPVPPASGQGLGCGRRPPCDLRLSTYHRIITGGRPHLPAGPGPEPPQTSKITNSSWSTNQRAEDGPHPIRLSGASGTCRMPGSSRSPAVPLACHSWQTRQVPSGQPRTTSKSQLAGPIPDSLDSEPARSGFASRGSIGPGCIDPAVPGQMVVPDGRVRARQADGPRSLLAAATEPGRG
jgi:hypothetical protein